jgi:hypothetical protein
MEHATQFPEEYSKVSSVQKKVRQPAPQHLQGLGCLQDQYKQLASCSFAAFITQSVLCVHVCICFSMPPSTCCCTLRVLSRATFELSACGEELCVALLELMHMFIHAPLASN